jgi:hypothetical protein
MYNVKLSQNGHFNQKNKPKEPYFFIRHVFSQNEHPFDRCGHFSQVEPFEKP